MDTARQTDILEYILCQIKRAENHKKQLDERLQRIVEERNAPIGGINYDPTPRSPGKSEGAASIMIKLAGIEDRIEEQKKEIENAIVRVMDILDYLPVHSIEREICELHYIDGKKWEEVEAIIPVSETHCFRKRQKAFELLLKYPRIQKMTEDAEEEYVAYILSQEERDSRRRRRAAAREEQEREEKKAAALRPGAQPKKRKQKKKRKK